MLSGVGFRVERCITVETTNSWLWRRMFAAAGYGEHHLLVATPSTSEPRSFRPEWLYRSFHS
jgi:hypothetical protein